MFFYKLFLLLCFIGCLKFTLAYNVPDDLEAISTLSHTSFRLYENPFFIYVDFQSLEKCTKESEGICICYWGFNAPPAIKLKNQLSPNEKKVYKNHGNGDREIKTASSLNGVHCGRLDSMKTSKKYRFNEETGEKWKKVHQGHLGSKFGLQKICISAVEKTMNFTDGGSLSHYEITVKTTGNNGVANDAHVAKVKRMASEGFLQLQFNTK
uniref:Uncharacterized protein n=1 Tax=Panagrolaimus sp. ES5 TaxID=591445 RepID=A0AC34GA93_9BILA